MKWMMLFLVLPVLLLASCGMVDAMGQYGADRVAEGDMTLDELGFLTFHTVGAERQQAERLTGGFDWGSLLAELGVIAGIGGASGLGFVRWRRGSPLRSGSGAQDGSKA